MLHEELSEFGGTLGQGGGWSVQVRQVIGRNEDPGHRRRASYIALSFAHQRKTKMGTTGYRKYLLIDHKPGRSNGIVVVHNKLQ